MVGTGIDLVSEITAAVIAADAAPSRLGQSDNPPGTKSSKLVRVFEELPVNLPAGRIGTRFDTGRSVVSDLNARVKDDNPDPRVACVLLLDTSGSMQDEPIKQLNEGFALFCDEIKGDPLARKRTQVSVITFGGMARVEIPFTEGRDLEPRQFEAKGLTPMGAAIDLALDELSAQKDAYRQSGFEYYRPWLFVITDGEATDGEQFERAAQRLREVQAVKGVTVFAVGVGDKANLAQLETLSVTRTPVRLRGLSFKELFSWLSASMKVVSNSDGFGASQSDQIPLPPVGWGTA